jgi:hypothetical protein
LSLRIYLDDCAYSKPLVRLLRATGHDVMTPIEAGTTGFPDAAHLQRAAAESRTIVTMDADDFAALHHSDPNHSGILGVCQDNDPTKDMSFAEIARAIENIEKAGVPIVGAYWILNAWRY